MTNGDLEGDHRLHDMNFAKSYRPLTYDFLRRQ